MNVEDDPAPKDHSEDAWFCACRLCARERAAHAALVAINQRQAARDTGARTMRWGGVTIRYNESDNESDEE
jgi:hypothetical protein